MKIGKTIYLDHQATTPVDSQILDIMRPYFAEDFGNPHSSDHAVGWRAAQAVECASANIAAMIGCDADEIVFTSGATEANNLAILGCARQAKGGNQNRVLLGAIEHKCILEIGRFLESDLGLDVLHIPVDADGRVILSALEEALDENVLLVSVMAVNNEIGTIQDIPAIAKMVSENGSILHCDAAQAPTAIDISDLSSHADMISISGHKMYAPMGIGALYIRRDLQKRVSPVIHGGGQQNGLRSGTLPTGLCVGLGAAAQILVSDESKMDRAIIGARRGVFLDMLMSLPIEIFINGPTALSQRHPGNINVGFKGVSATDLLSRVQPQLAASTGSACTTGIPEPSHVLQAIGLSKQDAESSIRFSLGRDTTDEDIEEAFAIIQAAISSLYSEGLLIAV